MDGFTYDQAEDVLIDSNGKHVVLRQMLDHAYDVHCKTVGHRFLLRWRFGTITRTIAQQAVWKSQRGLMELLLRFYDIEVIAPESHHWDVFHQYKPSEFRRTH